MLQPARSSCFPLESRAGSFVFNKTRIQYLNCDRPIDEKVTSTIDSTHAADTQSFLKAIFFVQCMAHERINRTCPGDRGISLKRRLVFRTKFEVG
jgi:hypothetical protein